MARDVRSAKVVGVGWVKTGTSTLAACLSALGYRHQSQKLSLVSERGIDRERALNLAARRESFDDWPWLLLYKDLDKVFPDSKFILTTRDSETWLESYRAQFAKSERRLAHGGSLERMHRKRSVLWGLTFPGVSDDELVRRYEAHNIEVKEYFRQRRDDLLVVNWPAGDGWDKLCDFLGLPVPALPFPHENKRRVAAGDD